jgi:hypothetical protein
LAAEQGSEAGEVEVPGSDLHQGADDAADHLPEEVGGGEADQDQGAGGLQGDALDHHEGAGLLGRLLTEEAEVVAAGQQRRGLAHGPDVERALDPPDAALGERRAPPGDLVEVGAGDGVVPGVETVRRRRQREEVDVRGEEVVDLAAEGLRVDRFQEPQVGGLGEGMDAGVGAAGAADLPHHRAGLLEGPAQLARHRARVLLLLPPPVAGPFVFECQAIVRHGRDYLSKDGAALRAWIYNKDIIVERSRRSTGSSGR